MSVKHSLLFLSLAALALGGTASAQERDQTFRNRDANGDGVLTQGEYGGHPGNFRSLDVNGDGVLSYEEFVRRQGRVDGDQVGFADPFAVMDRNNDGVISLGEWNSDRLSFRRLDRNGDGVVTRAEYDNNDPGVTSSAWQQFRTLDRNGDGRLSRSEARMSSSQFYRADQDRSGSLSMPEYRNSVAYAGGVAATDPFETMDRNNDGVISSREWRGDRVVFDRMDRNNDRVVSRGEYGNSSVVYSGSVTDQFRALDRNNDGVLSRSESRMSRSEFDRADDDNDGVLTLKEFRLNGGNSRSDGGFFGSILGRIEDVQ
jgi:Ca2+-binding EF-hand superfamily protein